MVAEGVLCWLFPCGQFLNRCSRVWNLYWHHQHLASGRLVVHCRYWPVWQLFHLEPVEPGGEAFVGTCHGWRRLLLLTGSVLRFLVLLSLSFVQSFTSAHIFSEKPRLRLASDLGRGKRFCPTRPRGSLKLSHSTPCTSGSSAASFAHSSAISFPSMHWWLGHRRISIRTSGLPGVDCGDVLSGHVRVLWPGPDRRMSSPRWQSVRPTVPSAWFLVAAHSAS